MTQRGGIASDLDYGLLLQIVVAQMPVGVSVTDANGALIASNSRLGEIWRGSLSSERIDDYSEWVGFHPDGTRYESSEWPLARSLIDGEIVTDEEIAIQRFDGTMGAISMSTSPIRDRAGNVIAGVAVVTDISDRAASADAQEAFLGVLAHELRTPITSIYAGSVLLERPDQETETRLQVASDVAAEADRLRRIVDDLLVVSRVERRAQLHRDEPVLIKPVVERAVRLELARQPEVTIDVELPVNLPTVSGDEGYLEQIMRNLLSNAIKYGVDGKVLVRVEESVDEVTVVVCDTGPGFVDGDESRVFDLFYRGKSASRRASGSGIGLFVVRSLAEAMGGRAWARTAPEGGGEVAVALPILHA